MRTILILLLMRTILILLTLTWFAAGPALAQPSGTAPVLKVVHKTEPEQGTIFFLETLVKAVPVTEERVRMENGKQIKVVVTAYTYVTETRTSQLNGPSSRVITPDGKQLPIDEVWKRLKANSVVAVSADGNTPAPVFLRALAPETLVIIPGKSAAPPIPTPKMP